MKGTYKSVLELLRLIISLDEFLVNKLPRNLGARLFISCLSFLILLIEGHSNLGDSGEAEVLNNRWA